MNFTISNQNIMDKPAPDATGKFLARLQFGTRNLSWRNVKEAIEEGYTFTYLYKDPDFSYKGYDKTKNYLGTNYIIVDVDKSEQSPADFVQGLKFKPTIYHTTFSNLTERKGGKFCFHLIYCLTETVYGEKNFTDLLNTFTADYASQVDEKARDCHRIVFTSNKALPNFEYHCSGIVYDPTLFIEDVRDTTPLQKITPKNTDKPEHVKNDFQLDEDFFKDLMTLGRKDFLHKWLQHYVIVRSSPIPRELVQVTTDGVKFADLRGFNYYEVPAKYRYDHAKGKGQVRKVAIGERQRQMFFDIGLFMECNPAITKEELVLSMVHEVWEYYDNSDKEMTNRRIVDRCAGLWENRPTMKPTGKKFKVLECEDMSKRKAAGVVKKFFKDEEIGNVIDLSATLEENLALLADGGVKTTKKRLLQFCSEYGIFLKTDKEMRNERIQSIVKDNPQASLRELEDICKGEGIEVKKDTIKKVIQGSV